MTGGAYESFLFIEIFMVVEKKKKRDVTISSQIATQYIIHHKYI